MFGSRKAKWPCRAAVSADVAEATARFERFVARKPKSPQFGQTTFVFDRGQLQLVSEAVFKALFPDIFVPRLPFIGAYAIRVRSLDVVEARLRQQRLDFRRTETMMIARFPAARTPASGPKTQMIG